MTTEVSIDDEVRQWVAHYGGPTLSLGHELCSRHEPTAVAVRFEDARGTRDVTYDELDEQSRRFAVVLRNAGIGPGDRVGVLLGRSIELVVAALGIWRAGAVEVPLFTAFGPEAVAYRLGDSASRVLVTDREHRPKLEASPRALVDEVFVVGGGSSAGGDRDFAAALVDAGAGGDDVPVSGDDTFVLLYTSGTTGNPKGVEIPVRALASFRSYLAHSLCVGDEDVYWNVADPGWAYGLWFSLIAPLAAGIPTLLRAARFAPDDFVDALRRHGVTDLAGSPTVFRSVRAAGLDAAFSGTSLRRVSAAGEPLDAELFDWSARVLGEPIHDHYGQSELGMALGHHHHPALARPLRPATMGGASPGYHPVVLADDGSEAPPGELGQLAIDTERSPLYWFRGYAGSPQRTAERFPFGSRYYLTGDTAVADAEGCFAFASRADDVITSSGYRIGPFEIESELMANPAVADVAVIGTPDPLRGEAVTAFVVVAEPFEPSDGLAGDLQAQVKRRLAAHLVPRQVVFRETLPRTPSGKVQRKLLREQWSESTESGGSSARSSII